MQTSREERIRWVLGLVCGRIHAAIVEAARLGAGSAHAGIDAERLDRVDQEMGEITRRVRRRLGGFESTGCGSMKPESALVSSRGPQRHPWERIRGLLGDPAFPVPLCLRG